VLGHEQKTEASMKYLSTCPVGCESTLVTTNISMPEGNLLGCSLCDQLISQCTENRYHESMTEFDVAHGTTPSINNKKRAYRLHSKRLAQITSAIGAPAQEIKLLDVGCSSGAFLNSARSLGFKTFGVEPAKQAANTAKQSGLNVVAGTLEQAKYANNSFDAITLFEVIEHLKEPKLLMQEIYRVLKPGGILLISTGNSKSLTVRCLRNKWDYFSIGAHGGHISFFNPKSMAMLAKTVNLRIRSNVTINNRFAYRANTSKITYRLLKIVSEALNPIVKRLNMGHDMIVVMEKNTQTST